MHHDAATNNGSKFDFPPLLPILGRWQAIQDWTMRWQAHTPEISLDVQGEPQSESQGTRDVQDEPQPQGTRDVQDEPQSQDDNSSR